jgi:hypothetical protein
MTATELCGTVREWLSEHNLPFDTYQDNGFSGWIAGENGRWHLHMICEEKPSLLQIFCHHPLLVPDERLIATGQLLHFLNICSRLGAFVVGGPKSEVIFRVSAPVNTREDVALPFDVAVHTFDAALLPLARFFSTDAAPEAALGWFREEGKLTLRVRGVRPESN